MIQITILNVKLLPKANIEMFHVRSLEQSSDLVAMNIIMKKKKKVEAKVVLSSLALKAPSRKVPLLTEIIFWLA